MEVVRDLNAHGKREGLAYAGGSGDAHGAVTAAFGDARDNVTIRMEEQLALIFAEAHMRADGAGIGEPVAVDDDLSAGNCGGRRDAVNAR